MTGPVIPRYGSNSLADIFPAFAKVWGVAAPHTTLEVPAAENYVMVLVDGLGEELLAEHAHLAPYLAGMLPAATRLTVGVPATTSTSLTSLGTGLPPGEHGIMGYRFMVPDTGDVMCPLVWDCPLPPEAIQPEPTMLERIESAGPAVTTVAPARFDASGLTRVALRGGAFLGWNDEHDADEHMSLVQEGVNRGPGVVYTYIRELDHDGHESGVDSDVWRHRLRAIDGHLRRLRQLLPEDVRIVITGDHGMVDVPTDRRIAIEDHTDIADAVTDIAGEGRFRHLHGPHPESLKRACESSLGERAWVRTRDEAVAEGWFGSTPERHLERIGDVVVAMRGNWALMVRALPREWKLVGMHASLTAAEQHVPLLVD